MSLRYSLAPSPSTPAPATPNPRAASLAQARRELRRCGSALLDVSPYLAGHDYEVSARLVDACDLLLVRFSKLERRAAA